MPFCSPAQVVLDIEHLYEIETKPDKKKALASIKREALICLIQLDKKDTVKTRRELLALHSQALSISSQRSS